MWWRLTIKLVKAGVFVVLLGFVGVTGFCYLSGDYDAFIVLSDSMQPAIKSGDLVFVGKPNRLFVSEIKPGAVVTYQHNKELVTHRVVSITGDTLVTKGDAMEGPDPWPVSRFYDVKGAYIARIPYIGNLNAFIRTRTGWFIAIILPAVFLLTLITREIVREALKKEKISKEVI
jgi:signal peptidase